MEQSIDGSAEAMDLPTVFFRDRASGVGIQILAMTAVNERQSLGPQALVDTRGSRERRVV
jgi:hypothetical protein